MEGLLVLLGLVLVEGGGGLVDFSCEAKVGVEHAGLDVLVVPVDEVTNSDRGFDVKRGDGVVEAVSLFDQPGEPALLHEDALRQFAQNGWVDLVEGLVDFEVLGEELGP